MRNRAQVTKPKVSAACARHSSRAQVAGTLPQDDRNKPFYALLADSMVALMLRTAEAMVCSAAFGVMHAMPKY